MMRNAQNNIRGGVTRQGRTIWITGLSGAGKSTLARALVDRLRRAGQPVLLLDGDELRAVLGPDATAAPSHTRDSRLALALRYARLCQLITSQGNDVVIATISLFGEVHAWNRANLSDYFEVFLDVPLDELRRRDPKGIYSRFDSGEISSVSGLDVAVDYPDAPDMHLPWDPERSVEATLEAVLERLGRR
jgi:adenylylsulfate kinase